MVFNLTLRQIHGGRVFAFSIAQNFPGKFFQENFQVRTGIGGKNIFFFLLLRKILSCKKKKKKTKPKSVQKKIFLLGVQFFFCDEKITSTKIFFFTKNLLLVPEKVKLN
jgi:hypothetical protein